MFSLQSLHPFIADKQCGGHTLYAVTPLPGAALSASVSLSKSLRMPSKATITPR
ncbi:hypothetical protein CLOBOL_03682, partial [Enterocloster bolteae ATCC BAA-613]